MTMWVGIKVLLLVNCIWCSNAQLDDLFKSDIFPYEIEDFLGKFLSNGIPNGNENTTYCTICNIISTTLSPRIKFVGLFGQLQYQNSSYYDNELKRQLMRELVPICSVLYPADVCIGLIHLNADVFFYIIRERPLLTPDQMCSILLQNYDCPAAIPFPNWSVAISSGPQKPKKIDTPGEKFTILHITDPHIDPRYKVGSLAECKKPMCCQDDSGTVKNESQKAGFWGDYRDCDTPWHTWNSMLDQIRQLITPGGAIGPLKYIYMTGDIINHRVWNTDITGITNDVHSLLQTLKDSFPNIKILPVLGNHEAHPCNVFADNVPDSRFSTNWLYEDMANLYIDSMLWLPNDPNIRATIKRGGYYTYLLETGLRIVALNSNVCYTSNWWLLYNQIDPYGQLSWLNQVLKQAESDGEQVHILSHVPSGDNTSLINWSRNFAAIINRYSNIVRAIWSGHTHMSELRVYYNYDKSTPKPTVVNYVGGSVTTFSYLNPNFRTFSINSYDYDVVDFTEYSFDLNTANDHPDLNTPPKWEKLYSFKDKYGLADCSPESIDGLLLKMSTDPNVLNTYLQLKGRNSTVFNAHLQSCDENCKKAFVCECAVTVYRDNRKCQQLIANMN